MRSQVNSNIASPVWFAKLFVVLPRRSGDSMGLLSPVFYLCTGITLNLVAQQLTDFKFSEPQAHIIPWIKFSAAMVFATIGKVRSPRPAHPPTPRQQRLMTFIGVLDASAYVSFCLGFLACGASLSNLVLSSGSQVFTALATRFILQKKVTGGQALALVCVCLGLAVRTMPPAYFPGGHTIIKSSSATAAASGNQARGIGFIALAALLYSALGVAYEALVSSAGTPPPYPDVLWNISVIGFTASSVYQLAYVVPRWEALVARPMAAGGVPFPTLLAWIGAFGTMFNLHMFAQSLVFKSEGALGVSLVNAVRGALLTVVAGLVFCSPAKPLLCLTAQSGAAAMLTTAGGVAWVVSGKKGKKEAEAEYRNGKTAVVRKKTD